MRCARRTVLAAGVVATLLVAAGTYLGRGWLRDGWQLFQLAHGGEEPSWPMVVELYQRKCAAVTPYLLARYRLHRVGRVLGGIGLTSSNPKWWDRVWTLVRLEPQCVPYLVDAAKRNPEDRLLVFDVLQVLGPRAVEAVPGLVDLIEEVSAIHDDRVFIGEECLRTLMAIGEAAVPGFLRASAHLLQTACKQKDGFTIQKILLVIREMPDGASLPLLNDLLDALSAVQREWELDASEQLMGMILVTMGNLGPSARKAVPVMEESLKHKALRPWAALALSCIAPEHREAVGILVEMLSNPEREDWHDFVGLMALSTPALPVLFPYLARGLENRDASEGSRILQVMLKIDPIATQSKLFALLESEVSEKRLFALESLIELRYSPAGFFLKLRSLAEDPDSEVALTAAAALADAGDVSEHALSIYRKTLGSPPSSAEYEFAGSLGRLARSSSEVREIIVGALGGRHGGERLAMEAAEWLGSRDSKVLWAIEKLSASNDAEIREMAKKALRILGEPGVENESRTQFPAR